MPNFINRLLLNMNLPSSILKSKNKPNLLDIENKFSPSEKLKEFIFFMCKKKEKVWKYVQHITSLIIKANKQTYVVTILRLLSR